jgi:hypothetical protein
MIEFKGVNRRMVLIELAKNLKNECQSVKDVEVSEKPGEFGVYDIRLNLNQDSNEDLDLVEKYLDYATKYLGSLGLKTNLNVDFS